jgi:hypothetical protein
MRRLAGLCASLILLVGSAASAETLRIRNGRTIHMMVGGKRQAAVGVGGGANGWRVTLDRHAAGVIELADVTTGMPVGRQNVRIVAGVVQLARESFVPGHAYTAKLKSVTGAVQEALLYLYPPRAGAVVFGEEDGARDDGPGIAEKGVL